MPLPQRGEAREGERGRGRESKNREHAVACAAVCSLLVASVGSISYIFAGSHLDVPYSIGFVYLPALLSIASMSMLLAPIGVKYNSVWPVKRIRRLFALVVLAVAFNMIALR